QVAEFFVDLLFVKNTNDNVLAVYGGHDRNAKVNLAPAHHYSESAVLRHAPLGYVEFAHDLDALHDCLMMIDVNRISRAIKRAVNAILDYYIRVSRPDVNIGSSSFERVQHDRVNQLDDRRHLVVAGQAIKVEHLFALIRLAHQGHVL